MTMLNGTPTRQIAANIPAVARCWRHEPLPAEDHKRLAREIGVSEVIAEVLWKRGIQTAESASDFMQPKLALLDNPFRVSQLESVTDRLVKAIRNNETVSIVSDYDVDGVTSTTLLVSILRRFGLSPKFYVPRRMKEGYGLTMASIERVLDDGKPSLLIALDCGTNSRPEVDHLESLGIDVIVIDHHQCRENAVACLLVNPHVNDTDDAPWRNLCTVGLVFKVVHGLVKRLRELGDPLADSTRLRNELDLVALGTVADLVPLRDENRLLVHHGLKCLCTSPRQGINALFRISGLELGQPIHPTDIAFRVGPRINASGRLADAALPVEMLLGEDFEDCCAKAAELDEMNRERQAIEREMVADAEAMVAALPKQHAGIVVYSELWHTGVVGIVAGKLARDFNRPCIVLGRDGDVAVGSGRSVPGMNLQAILNRCDPFVSEWGGHPMAVGVTLELDKLNDFADAFDASVRREQEDSPVAAPEIAIAAWMNASEIDDSFLAQLDCLRPFGEGNPTPIFGLRNVTLKSHPVAFGKNNGRFQIPTGRGENLAAIAWRMGDRLPGRGQTVEMAVKFNWRHWNGRTYPQAELIDWRKS